MKFTLKKPCNECPFLKTNPLKWLLKQRRQEIVHSVLKEDAPFPCHKTTLEATGKKKTLQHCAGMSIMLIKRNKPNAAIRIAYTLKMFNYQILDMNSNVYNSFEQFINDTFN